MKLIQNLVSIKILLFCDIKIESCIHYYNIAINEKLTKLMDMDLPIWKTIEKFTFIGKGDYYDRSCIRGKFSKTSLSIFLKSEQ